MTATTKEAKKIVPTGDATPVSNQLEEGAEAIAVKTQPPSAVLPITESSIFRTFLYLINEIKYMFFIILN